LGAYHVEVGDPGVFEFLLEGVTPTSLLWMR
jgi:hypothetical protein